MWLDLFQCLTAFNAGPTLLPANFYMASLCSWVIKPRLVSVESKGFLCSIMLWSNGLLYPPRFILTLTNILTCCTLVYTTSFTECVKEKKIAETKHIGVSNRFVQNNLFSYLVEIEKNICRFNHLFFWKKKGACMQKFVLLSHLFDH